MSTEIQPHQDISITFIVANAVAFLKQLAGERSDLVEKVSKNSSKALGNVVICDLDGTQVDALRPLIEKNGGKAFYNRSLPNRTPA